jgi:hypothetical protein
MFPTQIDEAHWAVRILEAQDECEVCGQAPEYGGTHCRRCRKLTEAASAGSSRALLELNSRAAMAAD